MHQHSVLIIDYGSQYTKLIARRVREFGIYSEVLGADASLDEIIERAPKAVILSGGPSSVYDDGAPALPRRFLDYQRETKFPVLGICYGMQLLVHELGGKVHSAQVREYGRMKVRCSGKSQFFGNLKKPFMAWMSHGDEIKALPKGFKFTAKSASGSPAAIEDQSRKLFALQFHPEVTHTEYGQKMLEHFVKKVAGLKSNWSMKAVLDEQIALIRQKVGPDEHVICALSGGVDSTVAATMVHRAIGDRLHCVFVDHGLLRFEEQKRVMSMFKKDLNLPVICVDAAERFLGLLDGVSDPEKKRKIIGREFILVFDEFAQTLAKTIGHKARFLVQGTLYPDVIESSPAPQAGQGSGFKHSHTIKSHHNVGGLPKEMRFELIEPLRELFKDEVRALGKTLKIPASFLERHPFPGPGLAVRVIGEITKERIQILQAADEIFIEALRKFKLYNKIWQAFAVFLPIKTVGVQGDGRTHDHVVALRAVTSQDGMTADWYPLPHDFLAHVSSQICNQVRGVNRVVYDVSSKPPATIEWE